MKNMPTNSYDGSPEPPHTCRSLVVPLSSAAVGRSTPIVQYGAATASTTRQYPRRGQADAAACDAPAAPSSGHIAEKVLVGGPCTDAEEAGHMVFIVKAHERGVPSLRGPSHGFTDLVL